MTFTADDLIFNYTVEQAIEDGELCHPFPDKWPWFLLTNAIVTKLETIAEQRKVTLPQVMVPLMLDCAMAVRAAITKNPMENFVKLDHTAVGTVWCRPNEKGGITVMLPEDY